METKLTVILIPTQELVVESLLKMKTLLSVDTVIWKVINDFFQNYESRYTVFSFKFSGMAMKLWEKRGFTGSEKFDERKYWAYGCHCFMLGDRPMTDDRPMPFGMPKDVLDAQVSFYLPIKA